MLRPEFLFLLFGYFITIACFLLWVRHLRKQAKTMPYGPMAFKQGVPVSPIANSEQPIEPVRVFEYKPSKTKPKKVFSSKSKTGTQRKTVTVKKRVTK